MAYNRYTLNEADGGHSVDWNAGHRDHMQRLLNAVQIYQKKQQEEKSGPTPYGAGRSVPDPTANLTADQLAERKKMFDQIRKEQQKRKAQREEDAASAISKEKLQDGFKDFTSHEDVISAKDMTDYLRRDGQQVQDLPEDDCYDPKISAKASQFRENLRNIETGSGFRNMGGGDGPGDAIGKKLDLIADLTKPLIDWHGMLRRMFNAPKEQVDYMKHSHKAIVNAVEQDKGMGERTKEVYEVVPEEVGHLFIMIDDTYSFKDAVPIVLTEVYSIAKEKKVQKCSICYFADRPVRPEHIRTWTIDDDLSYAREMLKRKHYDVTGSTDVFLCMQSLENLPLDVFNPDKTKVLVLSDFETTPASKAFMDKHKWIKDSWYFTVNNTSNQAYENKANLMSWGVADSHVFVATFRQLREWIQDNERWGTIEDHIY